MSHGAWTSTAKSHPGSIRAINEDAFLNEPRAGLWCVADGMGGHLKGDVASALIIQKLAALTVTPAELSSGAIEQALQEVNAEILALSQQVGEKIGSTVAVLLIQGDVASVLWAGDSRIYHLADNQLVQVTHDHNQAEELVKHGLLARHQAKRHPGSNLLTRAIGISHSVSLEHKRVCCKATDKFIICSDGLNGAIEDTRIEAELVKTAFTDISERLVNCALERRARDNVTVITVGHEPNTLMDIC